LTGLMNAATGFWFQSSPTPGGGRYAAIREAKRVADEKFQSSPTPGGGRYVNVRARV